MTKRKATEFAQGEKAAGARDLSGEGDWVPMIDWSSTHPGNRGVNREGRYECYEAPAGVRITIEEAHKAGPILEPGDGHVALLPLSVWQADGRYHLIYCAYPPATRASSALGGIHHACYAHSKDGLQWTCPELHQVEWNGSTANNILSVPLTGTAFHDPNAPPEERFRSIGQRGALYDADSGEELDRDEAYQRWRRQEYEGAAYRGPRMESRHWVEGWASPDGIHWKSVGKLADMDSDGGSAAHYDPETQSYFAYLRVEGMRRRATGLTRTEDFWKWPVADLVLFPDPQDPPDVSFYGCDYFPYPTNRNLHGAFVEVYHQHTDYNDTQIAFSYNMTHWFRPERRAIIPCGPPGSPDAGFARSWGGLFELPDGDWATVYRAGRSLHNYRASQPHVEQHPVVLMMAAWRPHRFSGIESEHEGTFTIPTLRRRKHELRLNYRCGIGGYITAELIAGTTSRIHPDADPIPGYSFADADLLSGDDLSRPMTWNGNSDLSGIGEKVAVRVRMFRSKLFAYSV